MCRQSDASISHFSLSISRDQFLSLPALSSLVTNWQSELAVIEEEAEIEVTQAPPSLPQTPPIRPGKFTLASSCLAQTQASGKPYSRSQCDHQCVGLPVRVWYGAG